MRFHSHAVPLQEAFLFGLPLSFKVVETADPEPLNWRVHDIEHCGQGPYHSLSHALTALRTGELVPGVLRDRPLSEPLPCLAYHFSHFLNGQAIQNHRRYSNLWIHASGPNYLIPIAKVYSAFENQRVTSESVRQA
jgi:hypothetical protein